MAFMLFWLPSTPSLASFGYPADIDDIENKQKWQFRRTKRVAY